MATDYFPRVTSKSPMRIYPRYSPSYQGYQKNVTLERIDDETNGYAGYSGRTNEYPSYHPYFFRGDSPNGLSYPPFGYVDSFKAPIRPAQPEILPTPAKNALEGKTTTTEAVIVKPFRSRRYRCLGYLISILAILTFSFEIADVIVAAMSDVRYCRISSGFLKIPWFFAWVVPGIWASIPIFVTGILAIYVMDNYGRVFRALAIISSVSAFFFAPAILAVSAAEEATFIDNCPNAIGNFSNPSIPDVIKAKLVLPIILIILAILEMLLLLYLTIVLCQAYEGLTSEVILTEIKDPTESIPGYGIDVVPNPMPVPVPVPVPFPVPFPVPAPPQPVNPEVISILVPRPPEIAQPPMGGVSGRVVYMEAHNHGYAYANVPGYFTSLPSGTTATPAVVSTPTAAGTGYRWY